MKKKILSFLLCLSLCLTLVLSSCVIPNLTPKPEGKTFIDDILCTWDKDESFDSSSAFVPNGAIAKKSDKFVYTTEPVYANESVGILVDKTIYRVYNLASGALIFEDFTDFDIKTLSYASENKAISVTLLDKMVMVTKTASLNSQETAYFYDENGNELLVTPDTSLTILDEDRIILNHKLYVLTSGKLELKKDLSGISPEFYSIVTKLTPFGDRYIYLDGTTVYVFDEGYSFLFKKTLKQTQGATFLDEQYKIFTLANGNIIFQTTYSVGNYSADLEPYTYDYISGGKCFRVDSYLLDIRSGSYKEFELSYVLSTVLPVEGSGVDISLPYGAQNVGVGQKIDAKKLVLTGDSALASFLLYNNGNIKGFPGVDGSADIKVISEKRFIAENDFLVKVYDENAKLIGTLDSYEYYNNKFIVTDKEILNHNLETVYSLTENNAAVADVTCDSVFVVAYDKEAKISTTYLITDGGEPKAISSEYELIVSDGFFATVLEKDGAHKLIVCKTNGEAIGEFAIENGASIDCFDDYDGYAILETKNIEGKTMYVTVFKTVAN